MKANRSDVELSDRRLTLQAKELGNASGWSLGKVKNADTNVSEHCCFAPVTLLKHRLPLNHLIFIL